MPVPQTSIRTSHAVSIQVGTTTIGQIQTWAPNQSRTITPGYQLASTLDGVDSGEVFENVPGNVTGLTIQVSRYDLFASKMEEVWGLPVAFNMLTSQSQPLTISEKWTNPDNSGERYEYTGCWFSQLGRNLQAQGDRIVMVNATLSYVKIRRTS
jgi:beta-glucanase (GH16 family)